MTVSNNEVQWFYRSGSGEEHGPFNGIEMKNWLDSGYFSDKLLIKTKNDDQYHFLGEYTEVLGKCPFGESVVSFNAASSSKPRVENGSTAGSSSHSKPEPAPMDGPPHWMNMAAAAMRLQNHPPQNMMGPGPGVMYNPNYVYTGPMMPHYQHPPYGMQPMAPPAQPQPQAPVSQPQAPTHQPQAPAPQNVGTREVGTETTVRFEDVECQTEPIMLTTADAAKILTRLLGQEVRLSAEESDAEDHPPISQ